VGRTNGRTDGRRINVRKVRNVRVLRGSGLEPKEAEDEDVGRAAVGGATEVVA